MWGGFSDVDSQESDGWDSGGDERDHYSVASKDWLRQASNSLQKLDEVKPSIYNIGLLSDASSLKAGAGKCRSRVRGQRSEQDPEGTAQNGHKTLKTNKTAWGSSSSLLDLVKQEGTVKQRPASAKLTSAGRPPSGKPCRPQSAHVKGKNSQSQSPTSISGMAILGSRCQSSPQPSHRPPLSTGSNCPIKKIKSKKSLRPTSSASAPPTSSREDNPEDETLLDISSDCLSDIPATGEVPTPVVEKLHFSLPCMDEGDEYAEISTESLLAKAMNRRRRDPVELDLLPEDFGGRPCSPSSLTGDGHVNLVTDCSLISDDSAERIKTDISQRISVNIDLTSVVDETECESEILGRNLIQNSEVDCMDKKENALGALKPTFVSLEENVFSSFNSSPNKTEEFSLGGQSGGATSSYVGFRHGRHKDDDIETVMSTLSVSEDQGRGQGQSDARSGLENQSEHRKGFFAIQSERVTLSANRTDQSGRGTEQVSNKTDQPTQEMVSEGKTDQLYGGLDKPCETDVAHNSCKSKHQGTVYCSTPEKNYYEMVRSESGSRLRHDMNKVPVSLNGEGEGPLKDVQVVGVGAELPEKHPRNAGKSHERRETNGQMIRVHSAGNNLLRRPRTSSASVTKPLRRSFPLKTGVSHPRRVTSDVLTPAEEDSEGSTGCGADDGVVCSPEDEASAPCSSQPATASVTHCKQTPSQPSEVSKAAEAQPQKRLVQEKSAASRHSPIWGQMSNKVDMKNVIKKVSASVSQNSGHYSAYSRSFSADYAAKKPPPKSERITTGFNLVTKKPSNLNIQSEGLQECQKLQDRLGENGVNVNLLTLKRALLPPDGSTYYYESSSASELPKCNTDGLLSHPKVWLRAEYRQLVEAKRALAQANERMRLQELEAKTAAGQKPKKGKTSKRGKKGVRKTKRSKSVT